MNKIMSILLPFHGGHIMDPESDSWIIISIPAFSQYLNLEKLLTSVSSSVKWS